MGVYQILLPAHRRGLGLVWHVLLCMFLGTCTFAASPEDVQSIAPSLSSSSVRKLFQDGPIDWKSFAPYSEPSEPALSSSARLANLQGLALFPDEWGHRQNAPTPPSAPPNSQFDERPIDLKSVIPDVLHDQRTIWTFPTRLAQGEDWKPTLEFLFVLGSLIALDSRDTPPFRQTTAFTGFNRAFSSNNSTLGPSLCRGRFTPWDISAKTNMPRTRHCWPVKPWPIPGLFRWS